ncbi:MULTISPECIES: LysR family transcriptional regulator [Stutzerimonas]|jgi:DNA-binding transcriptional LysR family regulator|uniref:LysR family transcriptional regulator n=2 Tax=Pseudomonadaceae TaxID=135621 RepID=A0AA42TA92_STUST|nr:MULTISPECIES: LysR family transcriptional regulator [Stutzerimonas]OHC17428.1 MAG: LysR family transcriptional regulator [Pseudomonadales bacterium RIFCSPHIGHO2_01_FULL_64_12]HAG17461.1 LysR family transcriptional regulator [Pseudomonas sp.]MDH1235708.1 LysR family transcriptional regulator [Stutzerimonas stutzeri]MDL2173593.1 LysR family transcriptional regulator [Stutzerimonas sp. FeSN7]GLZ26522.1 HTH-type transcriptional regulator TrpI [Stutzerimonas stutzeri]
MQASLPPLNALRAFEAVARLGSLKQAASELHVTHGAISRQVRQLEEQLGLALLAKEGRGVKLTDAGLRLRDAASDAFERLRSTCAELQRQTAEAPFVLGCPGSLLARWFIPRLDRLNRELPELRLQLSASEGELDPRRPGLDATLWYAEPPWPADMRVFELAAERIGPVLSPHHPRCAALRDAPPVALLGEALLHTASRPQAWPRWARGNGLEPAQLRLGQSFEHLYFLLEAALAGLGVAIAPQQLVADDLAAGRLLAPWGFVETEAKLALWVPTRRMDRRAEQLAEWLTREMQG